MKRLYFQVVLLYFTTLLASCVKDEIYNGPPDIAAISFSPARVTPDDTVRVSAEISSLLGIDNAKLLYAVNGGSPATVIMLPSDSNIFYATIPQQSDHAVVEFYIEAVTRGGITAHSVSQSYTVGAIPPNYSAIILNEVDGNKKFLELYNNSEAPVNISGMAIIKNTVSLKNEDGTPVWSVPPGTVLQGHAYGIIRCNGYTATPPAGTLIIGTVGDGMSAKQTLLLELTRPDASVLNIFQRGTAPWGVTISAIAVTDSYSRCPDGTGAWKTAPSSAGITNNTANGEIPPL